MQIQAIQNSRNNLNFGMAVKIDSEAQKYIRDNFSARQLKKLSKIIENQKNKKTFNSNMFFDMPIFMLKRAERYANKLEKGKIPDVDKVLSQAK